PTSASTVPPKRTSIGVGFCRTSRRSNDSIAGADCRCGTGRRARRRPAMTKDETQRHQTLNVVGASIALVLLTALSVEAQPDFQLWANFKFEWDQSHRTTITVDAEPKVLVWAPAGDPGWATLDVTPSIEYKRGPWFDAIGEFLVGRTKQTDDLDSTELTPRIGFRLHLLSNLRDDLHKERQPRRRLVLRDLLRFEYRNLTYS